MCSDHVAAFRRGLALFLFASLAMPAVSQEPQIPVYSANAQTDLKRSAGRLTVNEAEIIANVPEGSLAPFGTPTAFIERNGTLTPIYVSPEEYELVNGRDGQISAADDDILFDGSAALDTRDDMTFDESEGLDLSSESPPGGIDLNTVAAENGPVELFSDAETGAINPADGNWTSRADDLTVTGCPPGVEGAAMASMGLSQTRSITFSKPLWHPADMSPDFARYDWRPVGANGYFSTPYATGEEAAGSGMSLVVTLALKARSEAEIAFWARVRVNLAPHLAAIVGSAENCTAIVTGTFQKQQ